MPDFTIVEQKFNSLLQAASTQLNSSELGEVRDFIRVGEYGLALETFIDIVVEERKQISSEIFDRCREIAEEMRMPVEVYEKMRKFIY